MLLLKYHFNQSMRSFILIFYSLVLVSACIPINNNNPLLGKLKTLEIIYVSTNDTMLFNCNYNSAGYLTALESDSLKFSISLKNANVTEIIVTGISSDPLFGTHIRKYKIYTDANNYIQTINSLDTLTLVETPTMTIAYDSTNDLNTILIKGFPLFISNITSFNYEFDGNNYVKQKASWHIYSFMDILYADTTLYSYTSMPNNDFVPLQIPYMTEVYTSTGNSGDDFLLYLMNINGCRTLKKNKNLVASISSYSYAVFSPSENHSYLTNFSYVLNSSGQVSEMHVSNPDGTGEIVVYKMTYY